MSAILKYDTGPLNWVRNDIEAALQAALGRVQAFTADSDLTNALRLARDDAHQVMGALRMVGLEGAATVASALEMMLADISEGRQSPGDEVFRAIRNTIEGLSRWIKDLAEGRGSGELALFPLYRRLRELQGAERVFEGELFFPDLRSRVHGTSPLAEQSNDALSAQIKTTRSKFQRGLLAFLRGKGGTQGLQQMRDALAEVEKVAPSQAAQTFWWACVGFIDSLIAQGVEADFYVKQLLARIDLQMRRLMEGSPQVAERLLRDALFFVAKSQTLEGRAAEVRATFSLDQYLPGKGLLDPETLARMRPVLASLKAGFKTARESWHAHVENATAGQNESFQAQLGRMHDQAGLVGAEALPVLLKQLSEAAVASMGVSGEQQEQMNLEIAATLLFLQNAVDSEEILRPDFTTRAHSQGERLLALAEGRALPQGEALLDTQSQAVAERDLLHHLAQEVTSNLRQIEEVLDLFFRDAGQREGLTQLAPLAGQAQGALIMLELHDAAELLGAAVKAVEQYTVEGYPIDEEKDRIADAFSSLGLYIEAHCAGRADAGRILQPVMAGFGLACADAGPDSDADDSIEAGLDARKANVASAYLGWRDEGGEEASKKFLEILIELGRDAELIDDGALKHGVETLLAASRSVLEPGIGLDNQVSQLTQKPLPTRTGPIDLNLETQLDDAPTNDGVDFELPSLYMPVADTAQHVETPDEIGDLSLPEISASAAQTAAAETNTDTNSVWAVVPADSDSELLEIFLEEAGEVLTTMTEASEACRNQPDDRENMTTIRRGFHTLKGSGRMVGLIDLGEAAWGMEQFMNAWLAENKPATAPCLDMIDASRQFFQQWVNALVAAEPVALPLAALQAATEQVAKGLAYPGMEPVSSEVAAPLDLTQSPTLETSADVFDIPDVFNIPEEPVSVETDQFGLDVTPLELTLNTDFTDASSLAVSAEEMETVLSDADELIAFETQSDEVTASEVQADEGIAFETQADEGIAFETQADEGIAFETQADEGIAFETQSDEVITFERQADEGIASEAQTDELITSEVQADEVAAFEAQADETTAIEPDELVVGDVHLSSGLFDIFLAEAQQRVASLHDEMLRLSEVDESPISENARRAIHTLSGIAGTAGFTQLASLAHALELYWNRFEFMPMPAAHNMLVSDVVQRMQEMLVQISTQSVPHPGNDLIAALGELEDERAINMAPFVHLDDPVVLDPVELDPVELVAAELADASAVEDLPEEIPTEQYVAQIEYAVPSMEVTLPESDESAILKSDAFASAPEEIEPEYCPVEFSPLETDEPLVGSDLVGSDNVVQEDASAELESHGYAETPEIESLEIDAPEPASVETVIADASEHVDSASSKLDLTDLVPEAAPKIAAPVFERRDVADEIDQDLLPIFMDEAEALIPETSEQLRLWKTQPNNQSALGILRRNLHTLKGSARMVGAMRLGELTHVMESRIIAIGDGEVEATSADFDALEAQMDRLAHTVENLKHGKPSEPEVSEDIPATETAASPSAEVAMPAADQVAAAAQPAVRDAQALTLRVRADWVDRMVNQAGEVAIARSRIESEVFNFKRHVGELSEALVRLRGHIREVEIQAESQMQSTFITQGQGEHFDPLEFDRFTRFQEVTRFLAESVNDISTVHHILMARLGEADAALLHQTRLNRELQQNLLRVRMVPMYSVAERLYRTVRQTARDVDKRAQLDIQGGDLEIDRSVLEKVTAPLEHLLRNALAHGVESPEARKAAGKTEFGEITLSAQQSGNEMLLVVKDDGAGLNFDRIREKAMAQGMLTPGIEPSEAQLAQMIFAAGFSTAEKVSEVSGRGVGMDVVKSEIAALGGRIDITSSPGKGTQFSIYLPLTLAMTQAVMFSAGKQDYALPTTLVQQVLELKPEPLAAALAAGEIEWRGTRYPLTYLPHLLGNPEAVHEVLIFNRVVLLKSGNSVAAILVDSIEGTREIVVKNIGPQLARVTGIAGATVRGDGRVILILNPVPLALRWMSQPKEAREYMAAHVCDAPETQLAPLVLVVDDSLTVRKITGRLLTREGYRMDTAKDGVDALEKMHDMIPDVVLLDVEMPRMDGFELARVMRNDARLMHVPIIMITSRTAEKHRNHAIELGVNMYMGKPYQEQQLLDGIASLVTKSVTA